MPGPSQPQPSRYRVGGYRMRRGAGRRSRPADRNSQLTITTAWPIIDRNTRMKILSYAYRFLSNFVFLALVYYSLNFMEQYQQRAVLAILVLSYAVMRAATALRSFYFFQRI